MKISFVIPLHNEEKNAKRVIERVIVFASSKNWHFEIIPVDDRSSDGTKKILQTVAKKNSNVKPIYRKKDNSEKGNTMGESLIDGTSNASGEIIIWTMGDLADDPKTFGDIVKKIYSGYDVVFGSRYMPGGSRGNLDPFKAFLSSWGTLLARLFFGIKVHDITNAFRGFKKEVFSSFQLESGGFSISPEFAIKAHLAGFKLGEVPTIYNNRVEGISNFKLYKMTRSYLAVYFSLFYKYKISRKSSLQATHF